MEDTKAQITKINKVIDNVRGYL
ncbi:uncharacterized protein METZ01_LOCUS299031 [marine metagenome]|uniref:Uncharacterized protein n=1 Tax=marine metagenome TaxID=408172 RepID=A0A382MEL1_9ZZZZ